MKFSLPRKTLADYVAIAFCPLLIMVLVGSMVFFLLEIGYEGRWDKRWEDRLRWALFWFVIGSVLISRISIERGPHYAAGFGLALATAMSLFIFRFLGLAVSVFCLLAFIWWCTSKLTWDCTLIEDDEDASGEGLLQAAGIDAAQPDGTDGRKHKEPGQAWWHQILQNRAKRRSQPHAPGLWVVYFSLAALPLFGFGQLLLHRRDAGDESYGFRLLWVYVAAALGLLLTTSFLGLRRYLRQRHLKMPASMAASWIGLGTALAVAVLLACLILPRPDATYSITRFVDEISSSVQEASNHALLSGESGEGEGRRIGKGELKDSNEREQKDVGQDPGRTDQRGKAGGDDQSKQKSDGSGQGSGQKKAQGKQTGKGAVGGDKEGQGSSLHTSGKDSAAPSPELPPSKNWIGRLVKGLIYGLMALAALVIGLRKRRQIAAWWNQFLAGLRDFWNGLFGRKPGNVGAATAAATLAESARPFADYENPFLSDVARNRPPEELLAYTFEALETWGREQGCPRQTDQTPLEFARVLGDTAPLLAGEASQTAHLYTRLAYARASPPPESLATLEQLWTQMTNWAATPKEAANPETAER